MIVEEDPTTHIHNSSKLYRQIDFVCTTASVNTRCVVHNKEKVCNSDHFPIVMKFVVHDRSRLRRTHRKSIAGFELDSFDDKLQYIRCISRLVVGFQGIP